jgi:hypothetical protein
MDSECEKEIQEEQERAKYEVQNLYERTKYEMQNLYEEMKYEVQKLYEEMKYEVQRLYEETKPQKEYRYEKTKADKKATYRMYQLSHFRSGRTTIHNSIDDAIDWLQKETKQLIYDANYADVSFLYIDNGMGETRVVAVLIPVVSEQ